MTALPHTFLTVALGPLTNWGLAGRGLWFKGHDWEACLLGTHSKAPGPLPNRAAGQAASSEEAPADTGKLGQERQTGL